MGRWRPLLAVGGLLPLACETVIGAEFDDYSPFPDAGAGAVGGSGAGVSGASGAAGGGASGAGGVSGASGGSSGSAGGSSDAGPDVADAAQDAVSCPALGTAYPEGPYGSEVDQVFPPLEWEGFVNESGGKPTIDQPYGPYSMDAVRKTCRKYALIHTSEFT